MADFACGTGGFITSWLKELESKVQTSADQEKYANSVFGIEKKQFPYMLCITNMLLHGLDVPNIVHGNSLIKDVLSYTDDDKYDVILMNPPYGGSEKKEILNHFPDDLKSSETADLFLAVILYRLKKTGRAAIVLPDGFLTGTETAKVNLKKKLISEFNLHTIVKLPNSTFAPYATVSTNLLFFDTNKKTDSIWFYEHKVPKGQKHYSKTKPISIEEFDGEIKWWNNRIENELAWEVPIDEIIKYNYKIDFKNPNAIDDEDSINPSDFIDEMIDDYEFVNNLLLEIKNEVKDDDKI